MNGKPKTYFLNTTYLELFIPIIKYISIVRNTKKHKKISNINILFAFVFRYIQLWFKIFEKWYCETGIVLEYVLYVEEIIIRIWELLTVCVWFKDQKKLSFFFLIVYDIPIAYFTLQSIHLFIFSINWIIDIDQMSLVQNYVIEIKFMYCVCNKELKEQKSWLNS